MPFLPNSPQVPVEHASFSLHMGSRLMALQLDPSAPGSHQDQEHPTSRLESLPAARPHPSLHKPGNTDGSSSFSAALMLGAMKD